MRESALAGEADLLTDFGICGDRAVGTQELDERSRTVRFSDTLVVFATEFGRSPGPQGSDGRDHHIYSFSVWLVGGGIKGGGVHGATDEVGFHAVESRHYVTLHPRACPPTD